VSGDEPSWDPISAGDTLGYQKWIEYLTRITCSVFAVDLKMLRGEMSATESDVVRALYLIGGVLEIKTKVSAPGKAALHIRVARWSGSLSDMDAIVKAELERIRPAGVVYTVKVYAEDAEIVLDDGRTRFSALAEEMTEMIAEPKKPATPDGYRAPRLGVPQLFEEEISVVGGKLSPCPRCGCSAFTPNATRDRVTCRGCQNQPTYALVFVDKSIFESWLFVCACRVTSMVTIDQVQVNLHCGACKRLAIHDRRPEKPMTKVFSGMKAKFIFNGFTDVSFSNIAQEAKFKTVPMNARGRGKITFTLKADPAFAKARMVLEEEISFNVSLSKAPQRFFSYWSG
jgi:hypothetical protein